MVLLSIVATYLVVAGFETVERWTNPTAVRLATSADFVARVPTSGLVALIIGMVMSWRSRAASASGRVCRRRRRRPWHEGSGGRARWRSARWSRERRRQRAKHRRPPRVRIDARPFVFAREDGSYGGFLYDLCRSALAHAGVAAGAIELVPVEAGTRFDRMDDAAGATRSASDPTTDHDGTGEPVGLHADRVLRALGDPCPQAPRNPAVHRGARRRPTPAAPSAWCSSAGSRARPPTPPWPR